MKNSFLTDKWYIERKYHNPNDPFNPHQRWNYHGYKFNQETGLSDEQIQEGLTKLREEIKNQPHPIQKAKYFAYVLDNTQIDVNEHDYFVGIWTWNRPILKHTCGIWHKENTVDIYPKECEILDQLDRSGSSFGFLDYDHTVPDWDSLLKLGFSGILQRLKDSYTDLTSKGKITQKQIDFYNGCIIEYQAIIRLIDRLYNLALTKNHNKAKKYSNCLKNLRDGAPTDIYEAMQLIYLYFMLSEHIDNYQVRSLGFGLDNSLFPFYENDLKSGKHTKDDVKELLSYFLMQWASIGNYWGHPFYLGGRNKDKNCKVNELSYLILEVFNSLNICTPKIQIKVSNNTPKNFVLKALEIIRSGNSSIVFCNDEMIEKCLKTKGANDEQAIDSVISGCYEYKTKNDAVGISVSYFNALKPISLVFDNGFDTISKTQIGLKTGEIEHINSFEEFYSAYLKQLDFLTVKHIESIKKLEENIGNINPSLMFSSTLPLCVNSMTDAMDNGIKNESTILLSGLGSAVDSLSAVYELVFEKKITTLKELRDALNNDWQGYEKIRLKALKCKLKYGSGEQFSNDLANKIVTFFYNILSSRKNGHGGMYSLELHSALAFIMHGKKTKATPNGRRSGEETSKNASPHPGADKNGVTALIHSATSINTLLANEGFCLDVMLHPTTVDGENGLDVMYSVIKTYMDKNGQSIHFNIFNSDLLKDAQTHPEKYSNLQVRVCGWNVLWNNLSKEEQNAYIMRAEQIIE